MRTFNAQFSGEWNNEIRAIQDKDYLFFFLSVVLYSRYREENNLFPFLRFLVTLYLKYKTQGNVMNNIFHQ